jgi:transcriptional regulator GlxA family with amidase domain
MKDRKKLQVALLAVPEATASTLYGMYDLFRSAGRDWELVVSGAPGMPCIEPVIVGERDEEFTAANGVLLKPDTTFENCPRPDVICVPELLIAPQEPVSGRYSRAVGWIADNFRAGATVASTCSGAVLLAEAGILDGGDATTHWAYCDILAERYPKVKVHAARALVASGEGQRAITSGGGSTWHDLALFLIARFIGQEEAMRLAKLYLLDWHKMGQLPFATLARHSQSDDSTIGACQEWVADNYREASPVTRMLEISGLTDRTFSRRFNKATGMSPLDYVHTLRLEEAKQMLETAETPVETIAREVGYEDASFFRRLFRRKVGITPQEYRRRFGTIRKALSEAGGAH